MSTWVTSTSIFLDKDVFTDAFKIELVDDLVYVVTGKLIECSTDIDESAIGGNKSAEDTTDDVKSDAVLIGNIIDGANLQEIPSIASKSDFKTAVKKYADKLVKKVSETDAERGNFLKTNMSKAIAPILKDFKNLQFFATDGDELDLDGMIIIYEQLGEYKVGTEVKITVFKDGVFDEKCWPPNGMCSSYRISDSFGFYQ